MYLNQKQRFKRVKNPKRVCQKFVFNFFTVFSPYRDILLVFRKNAKFFRIN